MLDMKKAGTLAVDGYSGLYWTTLDWFLVPAPGFELGTYRLQGGCSTN